MKIKFLFVVLMFLITFTLVSCNNDEQSGNEDDITDGGSDVLTPDKNKDEVFLFEDTFLTDPVYDGSEVLVSRVVTNEVGTHIEVEGNPFLYIGAQIRVDAFMNCDKLNYEEVEYLFAEAAKLGVPSIQVPVEWAKMEIEKDVFDYSYLFNMLHLANKYNVKIELLWFGTNMCGDSHSYTVPNYILKDGKTYPKFDATRTGEFWNYYGIMWFLDFDNPNLIERESNAITKMMEYVYEYDSTHGGRKPVIGIQVLNEADGFVRFRINEKTVISRETGEKMTFEEGYRKVCNSMNALGLAVKACKYQVYTRANMTVSTGGNVFTGSTLNDAPEFVKMFYALEGIDIVGDDAYNASVKNIKGITKMFNTKLENNFAHIAENDGSYGNTASLILATVSQHGGYCLYDLITSPFYVANNSANIDQGIILFKKDANGKNIYSEFEYKKHYALTQNIIDGLKLASNPYGVTPEDFVAFNIKNDNPQDSVTQSISSTNVIIEFKTETGAIGYAIDYGTHLDVYVTDDSTITISNANVTLIATGTYKGLDFNKTEDVTLGNTINLKADTLYRIEYSSAGKIASTTWDYIGG